MLNVWVDLDHIRLVQAKRLDQQMPTRIESRDGFETGRSVDCNTSSGWQYSTARPQDMPVSESSNEVVTQPEPEA